MTFMFIIKGLSVNTLFSSARDISFILQSSHSKYSLTLRPLLCILTLISPVCSTPPPLWAPFCSPPAAGCGPVSLNRCFSISCHVTFVIPILGRNVSFLRLCFRIHQRVLAPYVNVISTPDLCIKSFVEYKIFIN
jgi:hypothetical protein